MPYDLCPGELPEGPMARHILNDPSVLSAEGLAPILLRSPPTRCSRVTPFHIALSAFVHETIQFGEYLLGHTGAEVVALTPDHRIHRVDQGHDGRAHMGAPEPFELPLHLLDRGLARFDQ
jgi:hypothetical protein